MFQPQNLSCLIRSMPCIKSQMKLSCIDLLQTTNMDLRNPQIKSALSPPTSFASKFDSANHVTTFHWKIFHIEIMRRLSHTLRAEMFDRSDKLGNEAVYYYLPCGAEREKGIPGNSSTYLLCVRIWRKIPRATVWGHLFHIDPLPRRIYIYIWDSRWVIYVLGDRYGFVICLLAEWK